MKFNKSVDEAAFLRFEPKHVDDKNYLRSAPTKKSIDYAFLKDIAGDYLSGLEKVNQVLGASESLASALAQLKSEYAAIFGAPIVDSMELTEAYQDRVQQVADAVLARGSMTKEEMLSAIENEARYADVAELKFKDTPRSTAWRDFVKDVLTALKGRAKFKRPGVAAAAAERKAQTEKLLSNIASIIDDSFGYAFPDGDPEDYIFPRVLRLGIDNYEIKDWLDKAARKHLHAKSFDDYMGTVYDGLISDNPEMAIDAGLMSNPYTGKPIYTSASIELLMRSNPWRFVDALQNFEVIKLRGVLDVINKNRADTVKAILIALKRDPESNAVKRTVRNLKQAGLDWDELGKIQRSIDPSQLGEELDIRPGDTFNIYGVNEAITGTVLSFDNHNIIIEGASRPLTEAEYQGRKVQLGKPMAGDVKKFKVFVKDPKTGNIKKVNFGEKGMEIKRDDPERRKSFRARHGCGTSRASDRTKAAYWSCRMWSSKPVSKILKGK